MPKVTGLFAWVVEDTGPDDEGVPATLNLLTGMWEPLMGADLERAESLRPQAQEVARQLGKPVTLVRAVSVERVEVVEPEEVGPRHDLDPVADDDRHTCP